jgi:acetyltransferase-like isoleucine patch superfamily enzyme
MNLIRAFREWRGLPPSRRRQRIAFLRDRVLTGTFYRRRLLHCGPGCIVQKPLFWTPEFISLGEGVLIWRGCRLEAVDKYGGQGFTPRIDIGDRVSFQQNCHASAAGNLFFGARTSILFDVMITDIDHEYTQPDINVLLQPLTVRPSSIGRNCFIGAGARIQAGTHLGDHCIVGTNAVVRGSFPDYCVLAGVPARIVKRRDAETGLWRRTNPKGEFVE